MEVAWYRGLMALPGRLTLGFALYLVNYVNTNVTNYWRKVHASFVLLFQRIEPSEKSGHSILSTTVSLWHYSRQTSWQHKILPLNINGFWHWSQCIGVCETIERPSVCLSVCLSVRPIIRPQGGYIFYAGGSLPGVSCRRRWPRLLLLPWQR